MGFKASIHGSTDMNTMFFFRQLLTICHKINTILELNVANIQILKKNRAKPGF